MAENAFELSRKLRLAVSNDGLLKGGGGDGTSGDMESRVKRLEDDYREVRSDLKTLLVDVAVLKERVTHLPTKGWAVGAIVTLLGLMTAIVTLAPKFQMWAGLIKP